MIIRKIILVPETPEKDIRKLCRYFQQTDCLLATELRNSRVILTVIFGSDLEIAVFLQKNPHITVVSPEAMHIPKETVLSENMRNAICILDMSYAFGLMIEEHSDTDDVGLLAMAKELKSAAYQTLSLYPCSLFRKHDKDAAIAKAEKMVEKGFGRSDIPGVAWTSFLLAELEKLGKMLEQSKKPENKFRQKALAQVTDIIHGIHVYFDPEYDSDPEAIDLGIAAAKVYATA